MSNIDFVKDTVVSLRTESFESLKEALIPEYLDFSIIPLAQVSKEMLAEKVCDYFEKIGLKTGKYFGKQVEIYMENLAQVVDKKVARTPKPGKNNNTPVIVPRSRKFFDKAIDIKNVRVQTTEQLIDYTRIMMCLYMAYINGKSKYIKDFDYSKECLNYKTIIETLKKEQESATLGLAKKNRFDLEDLYCSDTCTFILAIILIHKIMDK